MTKIIAVFGISGAGKSSAILNFIKSRPSWNHLQAGDLIKQELRNIEHDDLRLEGKDRVLRNQYLMIDAFWKQIKLNKMSKIIFDGHSIIDTGRDILAIPSDVIKALKPSKLLFIKVDSKIIQERRSEDSSRRRPLISEEEINEQQDKALRQFNVYSKELSLPSLIINNPSLNFLNNYI